jgi:hypothetical protein
VKYAPPDQFDFQPVIIIGAARSGTNVLRDALCSFDGVSTWPCDEINAIWRYRRAAASTDEFGQSDANADVRQYVRNSFRRLATRSAARWVVEKTCANSLRVDFVRAIVPESKFIFLIRDGRAVVASAIKRWRASLDLRYTMRKARFVPLADAPVYAARFVRGRLFRLLSDQHRLASWGPRFHGVEERLATCSLAEVCAQQWSECVLQAAASLARLPACQVVPLRYESFVAKPCQELRRIAEFLAIPHRPEQLHNFARLISSESLDKWRRDLSTESLAHVMPWIDRTWRQLDQVAPQWSTSTANAA